MNFKKFIFTFSIITIAVMVAVSLVSHGGEVLEAVATPLSRPLVIIDAGHGGFDGGAVAADGTEEKDLNLNIALKLQEVLELYGFETIMTRTTDTALGGGKDSGTTKQNDLRARVEIMNSQPDAIVISVHQNKFEQPEVKGLQVFYNQSTVGAKTLGEAIQGYANENLQSEKPRFAKNDTRKVQILEKSTNPTVIVECGFISNPTDLENLKNEDYCYTLSFCIANGILNYMQGEENGTES